mgnify:FL=1
MYSQDEWNQFVAELNTLPRMNKDARMFKRYFFGSANEGSFDRQGECLFLRHSEKQHILRRKWYL